MYQEALKLAYKAHQGQQRKQSCVPYIIHPIRVANYFNDDILKTIAILHDVVEDTNISLNKLNSYGKRVVSAVDALTRRCDEKHFDYIERVKLNEDARQVKIADIIDNLSDTIIVCQRSMADRYNKSLKILIN